MPFFPVIQRDGTGKIVDNVNYFVATDDHAQIPPTNLGGDPVYSVGFGQNPRRWSVNYKTANYMDDGHYIMHYVVFDKAGNASHYHTDIIVANNRPVINNIKLGTDNNADGIIDPSEEILPFSAITSDVDYYKKANLYFRVQNRKLQVEVDATRGNGTKKYEVLYVTESAGATAQAIVKGNVYRIGLPGNIEWFNYGTPVFHVNKGLYENAVFVASRALTQQQLTNAGATVYSYNPVAGAGEAATILRGNFASANSSGEIRFGFAAPAATTNAFNYISDSPGVRIGSDGRIIWDGDTAAGQRLFMVHVSDSTTGGDLSHAAIINIGITNTDSMDPVIEVAELGNYYVRRSATNETDNPLDRNYADRISVNLPSNMYNENIVTAGRTHPRVTSREFYEGDKLGYVQYKRHFPSAVATSPAYVSGMVIFKGKAMDNGVIQKMFVKIDGYNSSNEFQIGELKDGVFVPANTGNTYTIDAMMNGSITNQPWGFKAENVNNSIDYGNVLNWNFAWDSSTVANMVRDNTIITFRVEDAAGRSSPATVLHPTFPAPVWPAVHPQNVNSLRINIVPYISDVETGLSGAYRSAPSAFARSANGWYPVRENETITIKGFNFGLNDGTTIVKLNETDNFTRHIAGTIPDELPSNNYRVLSRNEIRLNVGTTATSGSLEIRVGSATDTSRIASVNNLANNNKTAVYNQEPNGVNNDNLTNSRNLFVWSVGFLLNDPLMTSPFMRMDNNANRFIIYGRYSGTGLLRLHPNNLNLTNGTQTAGSSTTANTGIIESAANQNRYYNNTLAIDPSGLTYAASTNTTALGTSGINFFSRPATPTTTTHLGGHAATTAGKRRLMQTGGDNDRFRYPHISTQSTQATITNAPTATNPTRVFMSHFVGSGNNNPLLFYYSNVGANRDSWGGSLATDDNASANNYGGAQVVVNSQNTVQRDGVAVRGGEFSSTGALSNGLPVVVWYDDTNDRLWLSHPGTIPAAAGSANYFSATNNSAVLAHTSTTNWSNNYTLIARNVGTHVNMVVDRLDNIHLAYYDALNGGLHYALIPFTTASGRQLNNTATPANTTIRVPDVANTKFARVDTFLPAGMKIMLNLREEGTNNFVPYITYFHGAFTGTRNTIRVAWRKNMTGGVTTIPHGTNERNLFTGDWEVMTVPARTVPVFDEYICHGVPTANTGWAEPQTPSTLSRRTTILANSIVLGYMTTTSFEGAILKGDMRTQPAR